MWNDILILLLANFQMCKLDIFAKPFVIYIVDIEFITS